MPTFFTYRHRRWLCDTANGKLIRLSELDTLLLDECPQPMPEVCPTAVRYAAANFDRTTVSTAYTRLRERLAACADHTPMKLDLTETEPALAETALRALACSHAGEELALRGDTATLTLAGSLGFIVTIA